jgi:hypothetical protein
MSGLSEGQIGRLLGVSRSTVQHWCSGFLTAPESQAVRAQELIVRFSEVPGPDRRAGLLSSHGGISLFHQATNELPEGPILQAQPLSVSERLGL